MKKINLKLTFKLSLLVSVVGFMFINSVIAEELTEQAKITPLVQEFKNSTRIVITTSGPAKFTSYWLDPSLDPSLKDRRVYPAGLKDGKVYPLGLDPSLKDGKVYPLGLDPSLKDGKVYPLGLDNPARLVVEFQTKNVVSKIGNELLVNEGVIKRITSEYYGGDQKTLKSLIFELQGKTPYKIWQEENNIILDIQASLEAPLLDNEGKEVFVQDESGEQVIKRLGAMEVALKQVVVAQTSTEAPKLMAKTPPPQRKTPLSFLFGLIGLTSISLIGLLVWLFWRRYKLILDKNLAVQEITKVKTQLQEQNTLLEHEQIIRKTVESTSLQREREFGQLSLELQKEKQFLEQEQKIRKTAEEGLLQKEKEVVEVKGSLESLKEVLVEKGLAKKFTTAGKEGELWISAKSEERREFPRLDLSKDYNRTIILRIESADKSKSIKSFANNIGLAGLCFETRHEFNEKERISVRLFFFGDKVPMMRMQAKVVWEKPEAPVNRYGVSFTGLEEKDRNELNHYIESKIAR